MDSTRERPYMVGVTGSIGSGKSTVCRLLGDRGLPVIDADRVSREVTAPGQPALDALARAFGADIVDDAGTLRRDVLAARAFAGDAERRQLEGILHPRIRQAVREAAGRLAASGEAIVVVEAAVIIESGGTDLYDMVVLVAAPTAAKVRRAAARGMDEAEVRRRLAHQWSDERKADHADWVVYNDASIDRLTDAVATLYAAIVERAGGGRGEPSE